MSAADTVLSLPVAVASGTAYLTVVAWAAKSAPWRRLAEPAQLNVWLATVVALMVLWGVRAGVRPGLELHLIGAALATLMFGLRLAIVALAVVLAGVTLAGRSPLASFGVTGLLVATVPAVVTFAVLRLAERRLPPNFFVYVFVVAFGGTVLASATGAGAVTLALAALSPYPLDYLAAEYLPPLLLLGWGEALLTGMLVTVFVVYRPRWVATFDDARYLFRR